MLNGVTAVPTGRGTFRGISSPFAKHGISGDLVKE